MFKISNFDMFYNLILSQYLSNNMDGVIKDK